MHAPAPRPPLAAVDVGSNTVHMLVARSVDGAAEEVLHDVVLVHVGREVGATGRIGDAKTEEVCAQLRRMVAAARDGGVETVILGCTEAVRRAADRDAAMAAFAAAAGAPCHLIEPEAEARLSYRGAVSAVPGDGLTLVADIGGGSTECVLGEGGRVLDVVSLPVGSGAALARWLRSDPPADGERQAAAAELRSILAGAPAGAPERTLLTGGTAAALPRLLGRDPDGVFDRDDLERCRGILGGASSDDLAARHPVDRGRVRLLAGGVEIVAALMDRYSCERVTVTHHGLRDGMILAHAAGERRWWSAEDASD